MIPFPHNKACAGLTPIPSFTEALVRAPVSQLDVLERIAWHYSSQQGDLVQENVGLQPCALCGITL